ncbi:MAG: alanine dehydrogenase [Deltaproteobacteria bacterium]|nr:alanine dehydrogenase [Deltaproteobacteria bacterium]
MIIGCPTEVKPREHRVGIVPAAVAALSARGHTVLLQKDAGLGSGLKDEDYVDVGAIIVNKAEEIWSRSDLVVKVKEPLEQEFDLMREGQMLYTYLHLAPVPKLTQALLDRKVTGVAYETIEVNGRLPLLKPMSEVAGKMSIQVGAWCLEKERGGKGVLLGGVPGVPRGHVVVIGGGVVGVNAAKIAVGMGAEVTILDNNLDRLEYLDDVFLGRVQTLYSTPHSVKEQISKCDLVIGAVLVPGARAPNLITKDMLSDMEPGTVIVDVAVDQGGCVETSRVTTHDNPTFTVNDVIHYGVANMPGAVAQTSTFALSHSTLPFLEKLADGNIDAIRADKALRSGVNTFAGKITYEAVAKAHQKEYTPLDSLL